MLRLTPSSEKLLIPSTPAVTDGEYPMVVNCSEGFIVPLILSSTLSPSFFQAPSPEVRRNIVTHRTLGISALPPHIFSFRGSSILTLWINEGHAAAVFSTQGKMFVDYRFNLQVPLRAHHSGLRLYVLCAHTFYATVIS